MNNIIDVLSVSESWLTPSVPDLYIMLPIYEIARGDSPDSVRNHGLVVHVNSKFNLTPCYLPNYVIVNLLEFEFCVINMYQAPSYSHELNNSIMNF